MIKSDIDAYFHALSLEWSYPTRIILNGDAYAHILTKAKVGDDLSFEIKTVHIQKLVNALFQIGHRLNLQVDFTENIQNGSPITYLDYRSHLRPYKSFKNIKVFLLHPSYWSLGKIVRYHDQDIMEMISVFEKWRPGESALAALWKQAMDASPKSTTLYQIPKSAFHFFRKYGVTVWGKGFSLNRIMEYF